MSVLFRVSLLIVLGFVATLPVRAETVEELLSSVENALEQAQSEELRLLSPRHFNKAADALAEAKSLMERKSQEDLIRIKLKKALDEIALARESAGKVRSKLSETIAVRSAALSVGADSLAKTLWIKAEERFGGLVREIETGRSDYRESEPVEVAGQYRAARREALREQILKTAQDRVTQLDRRKVERVTPEVVLRAHQALSRAEAALAQEDIPAAREHALAAEKHAAHALALTAAAERLAKEKFPWEAALLPYDDLLREAARHLDGELDLSNGGVAAGPQLFKLIDARMESLRVEAVHHRDTQKSYESALSEAQTQLSDAQARIAELEKRLRVLQGQRSAQQDSAQRISALTERIARAQAEFASNEAAVLANANGTVTIRLTGLNFAPGAVTLLRSHQQIVAKAAKAVKVFPGARIAVEGHTDNDGSDALNLKLSQTRAEAVAKYLAGQLGVAAKEIPAEGLGASRPIADNRTPAGRAQNRRVDIILTIP